MHGERVKNIELFGRILENYPNIKIHKNPSIGSRDGQTDVTKLIVAFCRFANAPKNQSFEVA
jgi:hypothetical protein